MWPSLNQVYTYMPDSMKEKFPNVKCIIDGVEFKVEVPVFLFLHKMFYSDYKSHKTVKFLVGICPGSGPLCHVYIFPGSISDKELTVRSGILSKNLWNMGEGLMGRHRVLIKEYTDTLNNELVVPSFLKGRTQFSAEEVALSQQIASERIHLSV